MFEQFLPFPDLNPIALSLGPFHIYWYAIAYVAGIILGWQYIRLYVKRRGVQNITLLNVDDMVTSSIIGILVGGRLGYVLFYNPVHFAKNPLEIFMTWQGGMSFHGGVIGVMIGLFMLSYRKKLPFLSLTDLVAIAGLIGIYFGRLANFVNGELYGRITDVSWAVLFPTGGYLPRHPSQLYEAFLEGAALFMILAFYAWRTPAMKYPGKVTGLGLILYAAMRSFSEFFREPDTVSGLYFDSVTKGQILSLPFVMLGGYLLFRKHNAS